MECDAAPRRKRPPGIVSVGGDDGLINHLTLVRHRETVLGGELAELFMGEAHDYRMRTIIKR